MSRIFISYRRDDSSGHAGRLRDRLTVHFGDDQIFRDIETIDPGEDFVEVVEDALGSCEVLIALIGKQWLTITDAEGRRRLDDPKDLVRLEIATALKRDIRVIPVLVGGATKPSRDLPKGLGKLARLSAVEISDKRFHPDVDRLIESLEKVLEATAQKDAGRDTAERSDSETTVPPLYRTLQQRLQNKQWPGAHSEAIEIIRQVSGHTRIDSKEKARAIPAQVLRTMNTLWLDAGGGPLRGLYWVSTSELTSAVAWYSSETWLQRRLKEVGL